VRTAWLRPFPGQLWRDPETQQLVPAEGLELELTTPRRRALLRGDCEQCEPPRPPAPPTNEPAPAGS
jgi:hypothetical protein